MSGTQLPPPPAGYDRYLAAQTVRDIVDTVEMVHVNANIMIPGDSIADFTRAWEDSNGPKKLLEEHVTAIYPGSPPASAVTDAHMQQEGLTGPTGAFKHNMINRLRDHAYRLLKPNKERWIDHNLVTKQERKLGLEYLSEYFEAAGIYIKSLFPQANAALEFISFTKQACKMTAKLLG